MIKILYMQFFVNIYFQCIWKFLLELQCVICYCYCCCCSCSGISFPSLRSSVWLISCQKFCWNATYFRLSPTNMALESTGNSLLMWFSMSTGGMFSPPAVITSSFTLPVMKRNLSSSNHPKSPVSIQPSSKIWRRKSHVNHVTSCESYQESCDVIRITSRIIWRHANHIKNHMTSCESHQKSHDVVRSISRNYYVLICI